MKCRYIDAQALNAPAVELQRLNAPCVVVQNMSPDLATEKAQPKPAVTRRAKPTVTRPAKPAPKPK